MLKTQIFAAFNDHEYLNLKTYRKSGDPMPTPVWFAQSDDRLYITTRPEAGKVKRINNNGVVEVAPCDRMGGLLGDWHPAQARLLTDSSERQIARDLLNQKYGHTEMMQNLMRMPDEARILIEITLR